MSVYPRNMSAFLNRLSGYNKNNVKMNVLGSNTANHGDVIQVDLPTNSIVDLSSLAWSFTGTYKVSAGLGQAQKGDGSVADPTGADAASAALTHKATYPLNAESVIQRLAVEVNGQTLVNLTNYNTLYHALLYMTATEDYQRQRRTAQSNASDESSNGTTLESAAKDDASGVVDEVRKHVIDTWLGFLGSAKPNFIDTSLLGNVRITITLAPPEIISTDANAGYVGAKATTAYTLSNMYFSCDVVSISDGVYDAMVDQMLASGAPIEVPFKNYFSFTPGVRASIGGSVAFNVASQSIDRLWAIARKDTYNKKVDGVAAIANTTNADILKKVPGYFNFSACDGTDFHFQVNNTLYPQWTSIEPHDWFQHTKLALGDQGNMLAGSHVQTLTSYKDNFFVYACQLEHRSDGDERFMSGIDTRGAAAQCYFNATGGAVSNQTLVFAECSSSLRIMANKVLEIVQ